jgi:hypothetical protein
MARPPRHLEVLFDQSTADRTAQAARHALLTCALAFGQSGGEREVLFAVARNYSAAARARSGDPPLASDLAELDDAHLGRSLLRKAENDLCAAAKALPRFTRHTVRRLVRAAWAYGDAWELDRASAPRFAHSRPTPRPKRIDAAGALHSPDTARHLFTRKEPPCHR